MYLRIRKANAKPGESDTVITISKKSTICELHEKVAKVFGIEIEKQQLFYKGKLLNKDVTIFEYEIQLNDVVILRISEVSAKLPSDKSEEEYDSIKVSDAPEASCSTSSTSLQTFDELQETSSEHYKVNDRIEYLVCEYGAWFEAIIKGIFVKKSDVSTSAEDTNSSTKIEQHILFKVQLELEGDNEEFYATFEQIRPRCSHIFNFKELQTGMLVLVNYNIETPGNLGSWYDFQIEEIDPKYLKGTIYVGKAKRPLRDVTIHSINEVIRIESCVKQTEEDDTPYGCTHCNDVKTKKCKYCGCHFCGGKHNPELILLCDECMQGFHIGCLKPPLTEIPNAEYWYCADCKNDENEIVKAGEKLKFSKKKASKASSLNSGRNWGSGMATVGRVKDCTIVPVNHFGPIPGVEVGTQWKFRIGVSESGVHRPPVGGIHGRETDGAYSLVLSGGYEDDVDNGEEFLYTGSGGRDLSGNKREAKQSCDQKLTKMNKALAKNCNARLNDKIGAEAEDWKGGKPVRVVRNFKLGKHSKYAPADGNRYDGIYKVVKYYPEKGQAGYLVWRYQLRRDDDAPAPWTPEGRELEMIYPPGYFEAQAAKEQEEAERNPKKGGKKRVLEEDTAVNVKDVAPAKKLKIEPYTLSPEINEDVDKDEYNRKLWTECKEVLAEGKGAFLQKIEEAFLCICCQELAYQPVTLDCNHNVCKACLKRSFSLKMFFCPNCRHDLGGSSYKIKVNQCLSSILGKLFPGYEIGR